MLHERHSRNRAFTAHNNTFTFIEAESDHTFEEGNKRTDLLCISAGKKHHLLLNIHAPKVVVKAKNKVFIRLSI